MANEPPNFADGSAASELTDEIARLRTLQAEAEAANLAKAKFLAVMSHEMRTPLNAILGMTTLALDEASSPRQREYLAAVESSADGLLALIDDILDYTTVESIGARLEPEPIELAPFVDLLLSSVGGRANDRQLELFARVAAEVPEVFVADPQRLRQVIGNLLNNAVKFTERGYIELGVELDPRRAPPMLHFWVRDTGIGVDPAKLEQIFEPFHQESAGPGPNPAVSSGAGVGLGLSICRALVDRMGGRTWATPAQSSAGGPARGTVVHLELPLEPREPPSPEPLPVASERPRVLVISALEPFADALCSRLARMGFAAEIALGPMGIEAALAAPPPGAQDSSAGRARPWVALIDEEIVSSTRRRLLAFVAAQAGRAPGQARALILARPVRGRTTLGPDGPERLHKPITAGALREALDPSQAGELEPARSVASPSTGRILVIEDDIHNRTYAERSLALGGFDVDSAEHGEAGLAMAQSQRYDLILTDLNLPGIDGIELTKQLRRFEREHGRRPTPIVALSAHSLRDYELRCREAEMDGFVTKPIRRAELLSVTRRYVDARASVLCIGPVELTPDIRETLLAHEVADADAAVGLLEHQPVSLILVDVDALLANPDARADSHEAMIFAIERFASLRERLDDSSLRDRRMTRRDRRELGAASLLRPSSIVGVCDDPETHAILLDAELLAELSPRPITLATIRRFSERSEPAANPDRGPGPAPTQPRDQPRDQLRDQPVVVDAFVADLVDDFLDSRRADLPRLDAALREEDLETLGRWGHSLKGAAGNYGFMALSSLGGKLVSAARAGDLEAARASVLAIERRLHGVRWVSGG